MEDEYEMQCEFCEKTVVFTTIDDGFFYCSFCNYRAEDLFQVGNADHRLRAYRAAFSIDADDISDFEGDGVGPTNEPTDCGSSKEKNISVQPSNAKRVELVEGDDDHVPIQDVVGDGVERPTAPTDFGSSNKNIGYDTVVEPRARASGERVELDEGGDDHVPIEGTIMKPCAKRRNNHEA